MALTKRYDANFEYYFWTLYPKKVGKAQAEKEWLKLGLTEEEMREMREHLEIRVRCDKRWLPNKEGKTFIVDPERFLKYRRFEDQYEKAARSIPAQVAAQQKTERQLPAWQQRGFASEAAFEAARDEGRQRMREELKRAGLLH